MDKTWGKNLNSIVLAIKKIWEQDILLSSEDRFFLESSCGIFTARDLEQAMAQDGYEDRDMILEMVIFPDQDIRLSLEPLLGPDGLTSEDVSCAASKLYDDLDHICLVYPGHVSSLSVKMDSGHIGLFVTRLFLDRALDPQICKALADCLPRDTDLACRVLLRTRNSTACLDETKKQFLISFIQNAGRHIQDQGQWYDLFELTLSLVDGVPDNQSLENFVLSQREQAKKELTRIRKFEEKKDRYSMEYLMMSRYDVPTESYENTFKRLSQLETILNDILGLISPFEPLSPVVQDLGLFDPQKDMARILNLFS